MVSGGKRGRKPRILSTAEKQLIGEFCTQLYAQLAKESHDTVASKLRVCKASLYNYLGEQTLPGYEVLKRAHETLGFRFQYLDFSGPAPPMNRRKTANNAQAALPFFETLRPEDLSVIRKKAVERENALELTIQIRFGS
jgi:hypothetical protein